MKRLFLLLMAALFSSVCYSQSTISNGSIAPNFVVTDTDGNSIHLADLTSAGYHVAINFVFEDCIPCLSTAPFVEQSYLNFGCNSEEVYFITIVNGSNTDAVNFQADFDFSFPMAGSTAIIGSYGIAAFPTLVLISPSNIMLNNDIWPIENASAIETAFAAHSLSPNPCTNVGCTDPTATNYDPSATVDDGSCTYGIDLSQFTLTDINGQSLFLQDILNDGQYILFDFMADWNFFDQGLAPEINDIYSMYGCNGHDLFVVAMNNSTNGDISSQQFVSDYNFLPPMVSIDGGSESVRLAFGVEAFPTLLLVSPNNEIIGQDLYNGIGNTLANAVSILTQNSIEQSACMSPGCQDSTACNFDPEADTDDGSCDYSCTGCMDPIAVNYDSTASMDSGNCQYVDCANLQDISWSALNTGIFSSLTTMEIGQPENVELAFNMTSSLFDESTDTSYPISVFELTGVSGLPNGLDYQIAGVLNGLFSTVSGEQTCIQISGSPLESGDFNVIFTGNLTIQVFGTWTEVQTVFTHLITVAPLDGDLLGCTYSAAVNYNPIANVEDGSCMYAGCTNPLAINYNAVATIDDGNCILADEICGPGSIWDFELQMCVVPPFCVGDLNFDGEISAMDLLTLLSVYGDVCE